MKALNLKSIFTVLFFAAVTLVSCKKNDDAIVAPAATIEGEWIGKYGIGNVAPNKFYSFKILPAGELQVLNANKTVAGVGTWTLDEQTFKAEYYYNGILIYYNLAAKYDAAEKTLTGSWGVGKTIADKGEFYLNKQ